MSKLNTISAKPSCAHKMGIKGQLTVFIIIGIVLLFSAALIIYVRQAVTAYKPPVEITFETASAELQPIQQFVLGCVKEVATQAVIRAGAQGGYVDTSTLRVNDEDPTEAEAISFAPNSELKVPYWFYMKSSNSCASNCQFATKQIPLRSSLPNQPSVEQQVNKYIEQRLASCIGGFSQFPQFNIQQGNIKATTSIARSDVYVEVEYPLTITSEGKISSLSKFPAQLGVNFGKFYDAASDLAKREQGEHYLGFIAMNLVTGYTATDPSKLPPIGEYKFFQSSPVYWLQSNIKRDIQEILTIYVPALQVAGTNNYQGNLYQGDDVFTKGLYNTFILAQNKTHDASVTFDYLPWWPIYVDVTPREGELVQPQSISRINPVLGAFNIYEYKAAYDISYPVLVTLTDDKAFDGQGFIFQFALEGNVRNNAPIEGTTTLLTSSAGLGQSLVCNPDNFNSGNVTIDVSDSMTGVPVEDADIYFYFGDESCYIGKTRSMGIKAVVVSRMPVGLGTLVVSKDGYMSKTVNFGTYSGVEQKQAVQLNPIVSLNASVARVLVIKTTSTSRRAPEINEILHPHVYNNKETAGENQLVEESWDISGTPVNGLRATETATILLSRVKEHPAEDDFVASLMMNGSSINDTAVELTPGNYTVTAILTDNQKTIIPEECLWHRSGDWQGYFGKQDCEKLDAVTFDTFPEGGVKLDSFIIDASTLRDAKEVIIYLFAIPGIYNRNEDGTTDMKHSDLEAVGKVEELSEKYYGMVKPTFT